MPTKGPGRRGRCRPLRVERDDVLHFVTCRTIEERFWLHPLVTCGLEPPNRRARRALDGLPGEADRRIERMARRASERRGPLSPELDPAAVKRIARGLAGSALARAQRRCRVQVFALVVMGNHVHLVVRTPEKNLAAFMGYFKARVADGVNRITGKRGPLWARRYDTQPILDDQAAEGSVAYTVANPASARLVDRHDQWPGLNLAYGLGDADRLSFEYLDCTAWRRARRPRDLGRFFRRAELELSLPPHCEGMGREAYRESVLGWLGEPRDDVASSTAPRERCLGLAKVADTQLEARPARPSCRRRPHAFGSPQARAREREERSEVYRAQERASARYLAGDRRARFPAGTYPPPARPRRRRSTAARASRSPPPPGRRRGRCPTT